MLTQTPIDPQKADEDFDYYESMFLDCNQPEEEKARHKARLEQERVEKLAWTKLHLHNRAPRFSSENIKKLDELETRYGAQLPPSVREWYSLDIVPSIMFVRGFPVAVEDIGPISHVLHELHPNKRDDLWYFLLDEYANQGGQYLCLKVDGEDDPPVVAERAAKYVEIAATFSHFIYVHLWDWLSRYNYPYMVSLASHPAILSLKVPERFHLPIQKFKERFETLANSLSVRFYDQHTRIWVYPLRIWNQQELNMEYDPTVISGCEIRCDSPEALRNTIHFLWGDDPPLYHMQAAPGHTESEVTLKKMQLECLRRVLPSSRNWLSASEIAFGVGSSIPVLSFPFKTMLDTLVESGEVEVRTEGEPANILYRGVNRL